MHTFDSQKSDIELQKNMKNEQQFSVQSTKITINPESIQNSSLIKQVQSRKQLINEQEYHFPNSIEMLKSALKLLDLNLSQQQIVINQVNQYVQQNKQRTVRNNSVKKIIPTDLYKKLPPVHRMSKQKKTQVKSKQKILLNKQKNHIVVQIQDGEFHQDSKQLSLQVISQSSIIKTSLQVQTLISFFSGPKVRNFTHLFKASQHNFNLKTFFNLYGNIANVLIVCQTNKDKVIGAYSPLSHEFTGKISFDDKWGQKVKDPSKTSFTFSLTNSDKFQMKKQTHTIYRWRDRKYLIFGDWQFAICDSSNVKKNSRTDNVNSNFFNSSYNNSKDSWIKLNGNDEAWFLTKEWQAWKVEFEN